MYECVWCGEESETKDEASQHECDERPTAREATN